ncbi:MAG: hypothetical protein ACKVT2_05355 [Saprospiraceae bacterium]
MKNLFHSLPAVALAKAGFALPPIALAKAAPLFFIFICLQACSQAPAPETAGKQASGSVLSDTSAIALEDSPSREYRLFKMERIVEGQTLIDLKLLRLNDLKEALVATLSANDSLRTTGQYPKFYWSKDSKLLVTENSISDSTYKREVVVYDLTNFSVSSRKKGYLLGFDLLNDFVFTYRQTSERQIICFFNVNFPNMEQVRELIAAPSGKLPVVTVTPAKKDVRVKAYMTGAVPINFSFTY